MNEHVKLLCISIYFFVLSINAFAQDEVTFPSLDGLTITADLYKSGDDRDIILLCHLAGHSRGEYKETAKRLSEAGYNCLALDARSGGEVFGITNKTAAEARRLKKKTEYLDAEQDIVASINYLYQRYGKKVILLGSSYSASLVMKVAISNDKVLKVAAFSPGEYFGDKVVMAKILPKLDKPLFVTSAKEEAADVSKLVQVIDKSKVTHFIPSVKGAHGSIALWKMTPGNEAYWDALLAFLKS